MKTLSWSAMVPGAGCERASGGAESTIVETIQAAIIARRVQLKLLMILTQVLPKRGAGAG